MRRLLYFPLAVLSACYLVLCLHHGTLWPWNVVVHEDGKHTLFGTLFYFEHAIGELPLDILLAGAVASAAGRYTSRARDRILLILCLALDAIIVVAACLEAGARTALLYLFQFHTRDDAPWIYGSHWHYHFLSQITLMLLPLIVITRQPSKHILIVTWVTFGALTVIFGISRDSFFDPRYLGHEARELFTHALVTIPLAMSVVSTKRRGLRWVPAAAAGLIAAYLMAAASLTGSQHHAQSPDWTSVICAHFFEHAFSYLVASSHALLFCRSLL